MVNEGPNATACCCLLVAQHSMAAGIQVHQTVVGGEGRNAASCWLAAARPPAAGGSRGYRWTVREKGVKGRENRREERREWRLVWHVEF